MTCAHALDVIDAGTFIDLSPATLAAARDHARTCPACGAALGAAERLTLDLAALADVTPPPALIDAVLARVERLDVDIATADTAPSPRKAGLVFAWASAIAGLGAALAVIVTTLVRKLTSTDPSAATQASGLAPMLTVSPELLPLAAVLLVFAIGLFASVAARASLTNT
jgi:hypothetical protein